MEEVDFGMAKNISENIKKDHNAYSEKLVQRVNELYFDFINEEYDHCHPEVVEQAKERWERIAGKFLYFNSSVTAVDIGTGTGFVPLVTAKYFKKEDLFICSDISKGILDIAQRNINRRNFHCRFSYVKIKTWVPIELPFETGSMDIVMMNSVLHHIKDTDIFLREVDRILKPGGLLFIGREPNVHFFRHKFLFYNYCILVRLLNPKYMVYIISRKMGIEKMIEKIYHSICAKKREVALKHGGITDRINERLLEEKIIDRALLPEEIGTVTDIRAQEGFGPDLLLPNYKLVHIETWDHIYWVSIKHRHNYMIRGYESLLNRRYPMKGSAFFGVYKK